MECVMIAKIKSFFRPSTQVEQLRNTVIVLSAAFAILFVGILVYVLHVQKPITYAEMSDSDRLTMLILSDLASHK